MDTVAVASGLALPLIAATLFSPYWWPRFRAALEELGDGWYDYSRSFPSRLARAKYLWRRRFAVAKDHWEDAKEDRRVSLLFLIVALLGSAWLKWFFWTAWSEPSRLTFVWLAIAVGTIVSGYFCAAILYLILYSIWEAIFPKNYLPALPVENPTNRVGIASPLGEARFPTAREVHRALVGGDDSFTPPKFME